MFKCIRKEVSYVIIEIGVGNFRVAWRTCNVRLDRYGHQQGKSYISNAREYTPL